MGQLYPGGTKRADVLILQHPPFQLEGEDLLTSEGSWVQDWEVEQSPILWRV